MRNRRFVRAACAALLLALLAPGSSLASSRGGFSPSGTGGTGGAAATPPPLTRESFAGSLTLDGQAGSVLSFTLPESVYIGMRRDDFRDLCVFDAGGTPVPFTLRSLGGASRSLNVTENVPFFPWRPKAVEARPPAVADIEINTAGGIVRIKGQGAAPAPAGPVFLLLDMEKFLKALENPAGADGTRFAKDNLRSNILRLSFAKDEGFVSFVSSVTMQTSADLGTWRSIGSRQLLVQAVHGGDTLARDSLALPRDVERYLLLRFEGAPATVSRIQGAARFDTTTPALRERIVAGSRSQDGRSIDYDLGGSFPLTAVGFDMPQPEMMATRLFSSDLSPDRRARAMRADDGFRQQGRGIIYRLEKEGVTVTGAPFPVGGTDRYWKLAAVDDIPFAAPPGLRAYWLPRELTFLARGTGPWTLAFGRAWPVEASSLPLADFGAPKPAKEIAASPAAPEQTGKQPDPVQREAYQQWVLWGVLGLAVVFLTGIALWIARTIRAKQD